MEEIRFELNCNASIPHFHNEMEILYILHGRMAIIGSSYNYVLEPEDFIVLNPYELHDMYTESGCTTISAYISTNIFHQSKLGRVSCCSKANCEQTEYLNLLRAKLAVLFKYSLDSSAPNRLYTISHLFSLLAILKSQFEIPDTLLLPTHNGSDRMQEVLTYLGTHFSEPLTIQEVAERVYLSKSHLSREFQKQMGISFSDYLRKLRLNQVAYLLCHSDKTITEIALSCGFSNVNTMILNFSDVYMVTPGAYRKQYFCNIDADSEASIRQQNILSGPTISYMNLLKHASINESAHPLDKKPQKAVAIDISILADKGSFSICHNDTIGVGWANSLMTKSLHNILARAVKDINFHYVRFHGALDDSMDLYHEDADGSPWLNFTYLDLVIDDILELGLLPSFEFGYTPYKLVTDTKNIFGNSCINIPDTPEYLEKWQFVVEGVMSHFLERYGYNELLKWRFSATNALYISYGVFSVDSYLAYYELTYRSIRKLAPEVKICAFGLDTGFITLDGPELLEQMLEYCTEHDCVPDYFTFQCFSCDYSHIPRQETELGISSALCSASTEPARASNDPDILKHEVDVCKGILEKKGFHDCPIHIFEWNSTIWQNDLSNDTCFKAAFLVKNILENCDDISSISYAHLSDNSERKVISSSLYHGGYGIFTYNGIPKAGYYAYQLLTMLQQRGSRVIDRGRGYIITRSADSEKIQIMLYHYCHYDIQNRITHTLPLKEQRTVDRYYGFEQNGTKNYHIHLKDVPEGTYLKQSFSITRDHGSSYDNWIHIGAPELRGTQQIDYLSNISTFHVHYDSVYVSDTGELVLSAVLDEHEVRMILIEQK